MGLGAEPLGRNDREAGVATGDSQGNMAEERSVGTSQPGPPGFQLIGCFVTGFRTDKGSRFGGSVCFCDTRALKHQDPRLLHLKVLSSPQTAPLHPSSLPASPSALRQPPCAPALGTAILTPVVRTRLQSGGNSADRRQAISHLTGG